MNMDPQWEDALYRRVGEEIARNETHPGPMARALEHAQGNRDLAKSLYVKFRVEELKRAVERQATEEQRAAEAQQHIIKDAQKISCPKCGHRYKQASIIYALINYWKNLGLCLAGLYVVVLRVVYVLTKNPKLRYNDGFTVFAIGISLVVGVLIIIPHLLVICPNCKSARLNNTE